LFNRITYADVYAADQLFATLDPTFRRLDIAHVGPAILVDTVGFIRHLPHKLVDAFQATLQETTEASLLLHVVDASDEMREDNMAAVNNVLHEMGALDLPTLLVYNKIDRLQGVTPHIDRHADGRPKRVWLSAMTGIGSDLLLQAIRELSAADMYTERLVLPPRQGRLRAQLYAHHGVLQESVDAQGNILLDVRLAQTEWFKILNKLDINPEPFVDKYHRSWEHAH
jgi:GTP-binding protein HflX